MRSTSCHRSQSASESQRTPVRAHGSVRAAGEAREEAKARREAVVTEVAGLESKKETLEAQIEAVTQSGDSEGQIRALSRERRELRAQIEDATADLAAQDAEILGAVRSEARAILLAMDEVWTEQPLGEVEELGSALDELTALNAGNKRLHDWSIHLVGRVLDGEGQAILALEARTRKRLW